MTAASLVAVVAFMGVLGPVAPFGFYLAFLGIVTLWMGYSLDWIWLRWPVAFVADLSVVVMAASVTGAWHRPGAGLVMQVQLTLFAAYLASIAVRTLWRSRDVVPFEVVQTLALLVVAWGGAAYVMAETGLGAARLGTASLVFGGGSYAVAFAFAGGHRGWKNFVFYTSLAFVFVLTGTALRVAPAMHPLVWAFLAVAAAALGARHGTAVLAWHSAGYLGAAALSSGLLRRVADALGTAPLGAWAPLVPAALVVLAASAACCGAPPAPRVLPAGPSRLPRLVVVVTLLLGAAALVVGLAVVRPRAVGGGTGGDPAVLAGTRTVVLAAAALLLAWLAGRGLFADGRWLMYAMLAVGGVKLLFQDFTTGRPATMFLSLVVYGTALIVAPRWARRAVAAPGQPRGAGPRPETGLGG